MNLTLPDFFIIFTSAMLVMAFSHKLYRRSVSSFMAIASIAVFSVLYRYFGDISVLVLVVCVGLLHVRGMLLPGNDHIIRGRQ